MPGEGEGKGDAAKKSCDEEVPSEEALIQARASTGDIDGAVTQAIRLYGAEIYGFLVALAKDEADASDAFSHFSERLWKTMDRFAWECSLRAWSYRLARNALIDVKRGDGQRKRAAVPLSAVVSDLAERVRTETAAYLRTESKTEMQRVRATLPEDDQELLILRIDRDMSWDDLARVFLDSQENENADENAESLKRESARLRKRFQLVKERVVALVRAKAAQQKE